VLIFALVGCGRITARHSELLSSGAIAGAKLGAVCDIDESAARKIGEKCSVLYFNCLHEMMRSVDVNCVTVLTESTRRIP